MLELALENLPPFTYIWAHFRLPDYYFVYWTYPKHLRNCCHSKLLFLYHMLPFPLLVLLSFFFCPSSLSCWGHGLPVSWAALAFQLASKNNPSSFIHPGNVLTARLAADLGLCSKASPAHRPANGSSFSPVHCFHLATSLRNILKTHSFLSFICHMFHCPYVFWIISHAVSFRFTGLSLFKTIGRLKIAKAVNKIAVRLSYKDLVIRQVTDRWQMKGNKTSKSVSLKCRHADVPWHRLYKSRE